VEPLKATPLTGKQFMVQFDISIEQQTIQDEKVEHEVGTDVLAASIICATSPSLQMNVQILLQCF
jgi:hypothetical protein